MVLSIGTRISCLSSFKITARYMSRDATHVSILKEDKQEIRVPIDKLSAPLKKLLRETPIIARRPKLVLLSGTESNAESPTDRPSSLPNTVVTHLGGAKGGPNLGEVSLSMGSAVPQKAMQFTNGGATIQMHPETELGRVIPVGGQEGWIAVGTQPRRRNNGTLSQVH